MNNEEEILLKRLSCHLTLLSYQRAEHCGHIYIDFTATEHQLRRLLKASRFAHAHIQTILRDKEEIAHCISLAPGSTFNTLLEYLEGNRHQQIYLELMFSSCEENKKLFDKFCLTCFASKSYCFCTNKEKNS